MFHLRSKECNVSSSAICHSLPIHPRPSNPAAMVQYFSLLTSSEPELRKMKVPVIFSGVALSFLCTDFQVPWFLIRTKVWSLQSIYLQGTEVGLFRSDYFFCCTNECIKQVEFNTIAASFGCLTSKLVRAYKYWNISYIKIDIPFYISNNINN